MNDTEQEQFFCRSNCMISRTDCMMTKVTAWVDGIVVNCAIRIGAWVSQVPVGHGTCPVVQILSNPLFTGIF
jgi:hypothetical protein